MSTLRVVVVDDEQVIRDGLARVLAALPGVEVVATCADGPEALSAVDDHRPDVLFLDVQMPAMDGLAVARALAERPEPPAIVFATAHSHYALNAFEVSAADYLLKPFDDERVRGCLARVRQRLRHEASAAVRTHLSAIMERLDLAVPSEARPPRSYAQRLMVGMARGTLVVAVPEIDWLEASGNYVVVHSASGSGLVRETMQSLAVRLDPAVFARVHRSAIVNLAKVRRFRALGNGDYEVTLRSGVHVTLSRSYRKEVLGRLQ